MEKLLKENSAVRTAETFVAGAAAMKLLEVGCIPLVLGVVAFVATTVWIVKSIKAGKGNLTRKAKVLMVALAAISTIALFYGIYHKMYCHNNSAVEAQNDVVTETTPDSTEEQEPVAEEPTEEVDSKVDAEASNAGRVATSRGYCPQEDRIEVTYGNVGGNNSGANSTSANTNVVDPAKETLHVKAEDKSAQKDEIIEDVENGKEKTELSDGIIATTDKTTEEKSDNENSNEEKATMDKTDAVEVKSEEDKKENNTEEKKSDETEAEEVKPNEASDDELDDMLKATETIEDLPKIDFVEVDAEVFPKADEKDVEEKPAQKEEIIEEVKPEEKAIEVEAIDGYVGNINSTMQFKISGTNVEVEGLDGIDYSFNNGILNINTGDESTVLTVEVSNSVSTVSFDIVINGVLN